MILRKPYKFLIKHFKIIHIIMFLIFVYFIFILNNIYKFFSNYVKNGSFTYIDGMASRYVPIYIFFLVFIIIVVTVFVYNLMRKKEKPILFYQILIGYSSLLLIMFVYMHSVFVSISDTPYEPLMVVINRDIALAFYLINFFYVGFTFIRGFGFDIKKFSFDQDKKELEIEEGDNEEFEVNIDIDKDDVNTRLKHEKREFIYYLKENAKFFTILLIIILLIVGYKGYNKVFVENKIYKQSDTISLGYLDYHVNKSYILTKDKNSNIISPNYYFVVVDLSIHNFGNKLILNNEKFRILVNDSYYYPVYNYYNSFSDLGDGLSSNRVISGKSNNNYLLVFKVLNNDTGKVYFEILNNSNNYTFDKIKLDTIGENKKENNVNLSEEFTVNDIKLNVLGYDIIDKTVLYTYSECSDDNCIELTKTIKPNFNEIILKLEIESSNNLNEEFIEDYFGVMYDGKSVSSKDVAFLGKDDNKIYLSVLKGAHYSNALSLTIKTRNEEYYITLR